MRVWATILIRTYFCLSHLASIRRKFLLEEFRHCYVCVFSFIAASERQVLQNDSFQKLFTENVAIYEFLFHYDRLISREKIVIRNMKRVCSRIAPITVRRAARRHIDKL